MEKSKLFISFTGTIAALESGRVHVDSLDNGLFVFGCTREHAINPGSLGEHVEDCVKKSPHLHTLLASALLNAEAQGRVRWRTLRQNMSFELVNDLLTAHGHAPLISHEQAYGENSCIGSDYCYPAVQDRCLDLEVVGLGRRRS